jgi:hypothetical protein
MNEDRAAATLLLVILVLMAMGMVVALGVSPVG